MKLTPVRVMVLDRLDRADVNDFRRGARDTVELSHETGRRVTFTTMRGLELAGLVARQDARRCLWSITSAGRGFINDPLKFRQIREAGA